MQIQEQQKGAVTVVRPAGPLTQSDADTLKGRLTHVHAASLGRFVLDASAIPYIDSRGLEVLVETNETLMQSGQSLKICAANDTLREVFNITELTPLFEYFEDASAAARSFL